MIVLWLLLTARPTPPPIQEAVWLEVARAGDGDQARRLARVVRPDFSKGGRVRNLVVVRGGSEGPAVLLLGPFGDRAEAVVASYDLKRRQPWANQGLLVRRTPLWRLGAHAPLEVRLDEALAAACRARLAGGRENSAGPWLAESLVARGYGYGLPSAAVPPAEQAVAEFGPWDRLLVWQTRTECLHAPEILGGPRPRLGPGPRPRTLQRHPAGRRCLRWHLASLGGTFQLAWVPASEVARVDRYRKLELLTRWGPAVVRVQLQRLGSGPEGPIWRLVLRHGAFPPVFQRIRIPRSCPPPYRLAADRLGLALYDARELVCARPQVRLPAPPVPVLWRRR